MTSVEAPVWDEWVSSITVSIFVVIMTCLVIMHGFKTYQDIYTDERKSVSHRRVPPAITPLYKLNAFLTFLSIFMYLLCGIFNIIIKNTSHKDKYCRSFHLPILYSFMFAKTALYLLFIARLYQVYGQSSYGYKKRTLIIVACIILFVEIATMVVQAIVVKDAVIVQGYDEYPHFCTFSIAVPVLAFMSFSDIIFGVGSLIAFLMPLRKTLKNMTEHSQKVNRKMVYVGTKYTIVVLAAVVTTAIFFVFIMGLKSTAITIMDFLVNSFCVMLMTPYYKEHWYKRLCFCCICCCDKGRRSLMTKDEKEESMKQQIDLNLEPSKTVASSTAATNTASSANTVVTTSVDTMDQIQVAQPPRDDIHQSLPSDDK